MNAQFLLHYIITHSEMLIGITIALALITVIFIMLLPANKAGPNGIDLRGIEDTLKKVIEKMPQGQNIAAAREDKSPTIQDEEDAVPNKKLNEVAPQAVTITQVDTAAIDKLKQEVLEREKKIKALEEDLAGALAAAEALPPPAAGGSASDDALAKIQELQSKLSEYAIIEEELADISKFKEENARLKLEVENLKAAPAPAPAPATPVASFPTSQAATLNLAPSLSVVPAEPEPVVAPPQQPVIEAQPAVVAATPVQESAPIQHEEVVMPPVAEEPVAPVAQIEVPKAVEVSAPVIDEAEDQVLRDFKKVVDQQAAPKISVESGVSNSLPVSEPVAIEAPPVVSAPVSMSSPSSPLDGSLDTSKMLSEIEKMGESEGAESDPMEGLLDTEKLLAEVRELGGPKNPNEKEQASIDDLMSEFEAEEKQIKAKAGS